MTGPRPASGSALFRGRDNRVNPSDSPTAQRRNGQYSIIFNKNGGAARCEFSPDALLLERYTVRAVRSGLKKCREHRRGVTWYVGAQGHGIWPPQSHHKVFHIGAVSMPSYSQSPTVDVDRRLSLSQQPSARRPLVVGWDPRRARTGLIPWLCHRLLTLDDHYHGHR